MRRPRPPLLSEATTGTNQESFHGTAEAGSKVTVYDGSTKLGTAMADGNGAWSFTSGALAAGLQTFTATAMDAAGNISLAVPAGKPEYRTTKYRASCACRGSRAKCRDS